MNRAIYLECDENCPCGESCRNRAFQRQEYADVYPIKTENRGWGLCAGSDIKKDTFIMQYIGEIYSLDSEYGKKKMKEYKDKECTYLMDLPNNNKHEVIDPTKKVIWQDLLIIPVTQIVKRENGMSKVNYV